MSVQFPSNVKKLLDNKQIAYTMTMYADDKDPQPQDYRDQHLRDQSVARSILLEDSEGKLLALIPGDCMLDLQRLRQLTQRTLAPVSPREWEKFTRSKNLDAIPAIPNIAGLTTVIDERLVNGGKSVLLDSGKSPHLLQVDNQALAELMENKALCLDIAISIADVEQSCRNPGGDMKDISNAVSNFTQLRIKQRLEDTLELPPLPQTAQRIIKLRVDPNADISDLSEIVETDPSLAAQVVSWASSPYYSAPGKIRSIHDAIVRVLGFDMVLNLALGIALSRTLEIPKSGPYGIQPYWRSAVYTAAIMEALVTAIPRQYRPGFGLAYLSGLLHNFGFLILADVFPPHFDRLCDTWNANPHVSHQVVEKQLLGVNRAQLAAWLMESWHMPEEVVVALRHQNDPSYQGEHAVYANLLYIAQALLQKYNMGSGPTVYLSNELLARVHLERSGLDETVSSIMNSKMELENIAGELAG
ncbi:aminoacyl-tRNA deacylase and HDOD domain-containing protein [Halioxenophilus sp. WMMB6]|uniref:aminoacyl-tRNA deacylase and HDOD domain-containing protein n=1 Tax=Halioxenophilus sp. WMMB6 TaxID=3073815 RepID=UPI00295E5DB1|nr:HDOD domain-containing protein [Halioxenophilus sp. WMMB6]